MTEQADAALTEAIEELTDSLMEATAAFLSAKMHGDEVAVDAMVVELGAEVLLEAVTSAFVSSIRASGYPPEVFLQQLVDATPSRSRRAGRRAFVRSR